jgi:L-alanine-DL-glutamate epimerase-like enolase superfamily enzyme
MNASVTSARCLSWHAETWALREPFSFSGQHWTDYALLLCEVEQAGCLGRGEAFGVYYLGETVATMQQQLATCEQAVADGLTRQALLQRLPPGGARNALDCALWDLEARLSGRSAWEMAGVQEAPALTVFNIGIHPEPEDMAARPDARLFVDANQAWTLAQLKAVAPALAALGVEMIEQPLPRGADAELAGYRCPLPLCADESCVHEGELERVRPYYQRVAIKLDKAGGLTAALALAQAVKAAGLQVVGGSMMGTSLAMAPTHVLAQHALFTDLDSPLHSRFDRAERVRYGSGMVLPSLRGAWGHAHSGLEAPPQRASGT